MEKGTEGIFRVERSEAVEYLWENGGENAAGEQERVDLCYSKGVGYEEEDFVRESDERHFFPGIF